MRVDKSNITPITSSQLPFKHGFFTRNGGVSEGVYASLNCALNASDKIDYVLENRERVLSFLLPDVKANLHIPNQSHSAKVLSVDRNTQCQSLPRADAFITKEAMLPIAVLTADCGPLLFCDSHAGVIAACHAGWRGALGGICASTIAAMCQVGATPQHIVAVLGPMIQQESYEVGHDFYSHFYAAEMANQRFFSLSTEAGKYHFDLSGYILSRLQQFDLKAIESIALDTYQESSLFFSYRRSQKHNNSDFGRQISVISL